MRRHAIVLILILAILSIGGRLDWVKSFAFYYGGDKLEELSEFDLVVLEPENYSKDDIDYLKSKGVKVVSYVTIGESDTKDVDPSWVLAENPNWHSLIIDVRKEGWRKRIIEYMKKLKDMGYDGFFLDTVDTAVSFPQVKDAMVQFIAQIRENFPNSIIIQNRGLPLLEETGKYIDAVLWEDFASGYNWTKGDYERREVSPAFVKQMKDLSEKYGFTILALNYSWEDDLNMRKYIHDMCSKYQIKCYTTDLYVSRIYKPYKPGMKIEEVSYDFSNVVDTVIMGSNEKDHIYGPMGGDSGWVASGTIYGTFYRRCKGWDAGVVLTFEEKKDSGFYVVYYDGGIEDMALKITTNTGSGWPFIASIPVGDSDMFKVAEVKLRESDMFDTDKKKEGIQQEFGFQGAKVAVIGALKKPELNIGGVKIYKRKKRFRLKFKVGNSSPVDSGPFNVVVSMDGKVVLSERIESLGMNEEKEFIIRSKSPPERVVIRIDAENEVDEIIESNNEIELNP